MPGKDNNMEILMQYLNDYLPMMFYDLFRGFTIFIIALGFVYVFGRMLDVLKTPRQKNSFAFILFIPLSYWSVMIYDRQYLFAEEVYWKTIVYISIASIFYVLIGFKLYDRTEEIINRKIKKEKK